MLLIHKMLIDIVYSVFGVVCFTNMLLLVSIGGASCIVGTFINLQIVQFDLSDVRVGDVG